MRDILQQNHAYSKEAEECLVNLIAQQFPKLLQGLTCQALGRHAYSMQQIHVHMWVSLALKS